MTKKISILYRAKNTIEIQDGYTEFEKAYPKWDERRRWVFEFPVRRVWK